MKEMKNRIFLVLIVILISTFVSLAFNVTDLMEEQNIVMKNLSQVEYLSSSTQRASKNVNAGFKDNKVIYYIKEETFSILDPSSSECLYLIENTKIKACAKVILDELEILLNLFELTETNPNENYNIDIILASDNHFNNMTNLSILITEEADLLAIEIDDMRLHSYITLMLLCLLLGVILVSGAVELRTSIKISKLATIDIATGLNNRSECQEILRDLAPTGVITQNAIIVIDLNDLKIVNDQHGHQAGDELISSFANLLSETADIHAKRPFLGRYGGDEFIIYYEDIQQYEVDRFIAKLSELVQSFNGNSEKIFSISYAIGYAIDNEGLPARKLFEKADETMYENKKLMKRRKEDVK